MRLLSWPSRLAAAGLLLALAACGGSKNEAYIEKPVDDLYNKAMDALVEEHYATRPRLSSRSKASTPIRSGRPKAS